MEEKIIEWSVYCVWWDSDKRDEKKFQSFEDAKEFAEQHATSQGEWEVFNMRTLTSVQYVPRGGLAGGKIYARIESSQPKEQEI